LFRNESNVGYNVNFSRACEKARGAYIAIADQDDIWELDKIELLLNAINADPAIIMAHGISARFEEKSKPHLNSIKCLNNYTGNDIRNFYLKNVISGHSMMFRKELLDKALPFPAAVYYDWWLVANACVAGKIKAVDKILVWHRMHSNNATGAAKPKVYFFKQQQIILSNLLQIKGLSEEAKAFGDKLLQYYYEFPHKRFSFPLFFLLLKYSSIVFAYKRRRVPSLSYLKFAYRFSHRKTLA
jgi:glycosyltransferase involved in cell wall biosynthesis